MDQNLLDYLNSSDDPNSSVFDDEIKNVPINELKIIPFENLKITTMVLIFYFNGLVNLDKIFFLFPITKIILPSPRRVTKKFKLPPCNIPGAILSIRYKGMTRGIVRSKSSSHFSHSITIDIATSIKLVSVKLAPQSIHMCGANSLETGWEGANHIINHVAYIQKIIEKIKNNKELAKRTIEWVKEITQGDMVIKNTFTQMGKIKLQKHTIDHLIKKYEESPILPEYVDPEIALYLVNLSDEFLYYSDLQAKLDWIITLEGVHNEKLEIISLSKAMVNYNYNLGFPVKRYELFKIMDKRDGFFARFNNTVDHSVTIELHCESDEKIQKKTRKKNSTPCHTFIIYRSGCVTQSGPDEELMKEAYYKFMNLINKFRDEIIGELPVVKKKTK